MHTVFGYINFWPLTGSPWEGCCTRRRKHTQLNNCMYRMYFAKVQNFGTYDSQLLTIRGNNKNLKNYRGRCYTEKLKIDIGQLEKEKKKQVRFQIGFLQVLWDVLTLIDGRVCLLWHCRLCCGQMWNITENLNPDREKQQQVRSFGKTRSNCYLSDVPLHTEEGTFLLN